MYYSVFVNLKIPDPANNTPNTLFGTRLSRPYSAKAAQIKGAALERCKTTPSDRSKTTR